MKAVIEAKRLTRKFGNFVAVDQVEFRVYQGEVFGFLGPNGAGKTTTVRMLTGVINPTEGTATIQGHDICKEPLISRTHIAVVPEEANVYLDLSVWQNLMLMADLHGVARHRCFQEAERLLELLGLLERKRQKARVLSKGLRQRLMLCAALVTGPEVLFLASPPASGPSNIMLLSNLVRLPLLFVSGIFMPIGQMPVWAQWIAPLSPLSYASALIRTAFGRSAFFSVWLSLLMLVLFTLVFFMASCKFHNMWRAKGL